MRLSGRGRAAAGVMLAVGGLLIGLSSCGRGSGTATPTKAARAVFARRYLALVAPTTAADSEFDTQLRAAGGKPFASTNGFVHTYVHALETYDTGLTQLDWPATLKPDAVTLEQAVAAVIGDVSSLPTQTAGSIGPWARQVQVDAQKANAAGNTLRHDLRLPPAPAAANAPAGR